ncbi:MAG: hypothetical protein Q8P54_01330 [bacterium]|nr:hypothetical protein [bacterium]
MYRETCSECKEGNHTACTPRRLLWGELPRYCDCKVCGHNRKFEPFEPRIEVFDSLLMPTERPVTQVSLLNKQIADIQATCRHDEILLLEPIKLEESLVDGVFIVGNESGVFARITAECFDCNEQWEFSCIEACPRCLRIVGRYVGEHTTDATDYYYDHNEWSYYSAVVYHCVNCDFAAVTKEWDQ